MTTPEPSAAFTSEPTAPPLGESRVMLPAGATASQPSSSAARTWGRRIVDALLIGLVLGFAFLAASYAVRNSDFWLHLAGGRLLAEGRYPFGADPFAYTTENVYWANHAWLFDWLLYLVYQASGGVVLALGKAVLIAVLAGLMLAMRRAGGIAVPAACTLLAILALSPYLQLRSTLLSYVFLGLTLYLLRRPRGVSSARFRDWKQDLPLLLLFVVWVNVDSWFLLGPLSALLFWLGDRLRPERGETEARTPAWLWLAGAAVCLLNPYHVHAFRLPVELLPLPAALQSDVRWQRLIVAPWGWSQYYYPAAGVNLANCAYLALLGVGLLSFVLNARGAAGWRLLIWLVLAGLSAWRSAAIPFFAVAAGPITALNLQDLASAGDDRKRFVPSFGRALLVLSGGALLLLAWTGWLEGFHRALGRQVEWSVQPDGSLQRVAQTLQRWHEEGKLQPGERGFASHPSVVHYCAWFCPEEKGFVDLRLPLFAAAAGDFENVCRALGLDLGTKEAKPPGDWRKILRTHGITHLVLYDPSPRRLAPALLRLAGERSSWSLLHVDGQALILGWNDGERTLPANLPPFDADRVAFAPTVADVMMLPPAPAEVSPRGPRSADWRRLLTEAPPSPSWEADAARVLLGYFEGNVAPQYRRRQTRCIAWQASLAGLPALSSSSLDAALRVAAGAEAAPLVPADLQQCSPALPLLAVRAARRALAVDPEDAMAYLNLGRAYFALALRTPERVIGGQFQPLARLRFIQIACALENALRRDPDLLEAHEGLAELYQQRNYLDAALEHRRATLRLMKRLGRFAGEEEPAYRQRLEQAAKIVDELERTVGDRKNRFAIEVEKVGGEVSAKAQLAIHMGLVRYALNEILLPAPIVLLDSKGIHLQMELLLLLGDIDPVRAQLRDPDWQANKSKLGHFELPVFPATEAKPRPYQPAAYEWLLVCQSAADGDYKQAEEALRAIRTDLGGETVRKEIQGPRRELAAAVALEIAWAASPMSDFPHGHGEYNLHERFKQSRLSWSGIVSGSSLVLVEQADMCVLSGLLALERGSPREAEQLFAESVQLAGASSDLVQPSVAQPLAKEYLHILHSARARKAR